MTSKCITYHDNRGAVVKPPPFNAAECFIAFSNPDVLRGFHYHEGQDRLITCLEGETYTVLYELATGEWQNYILTPFKTLYAPREYAHAYCTLVGAKLLYQTSTSYEPTLDHGFHWRSVGVIWPVENPVMNTRDKELPPL